jgi:hypothetical protein
MMHTSIACLTAIAFSFAVSACGGGDSAFPPAQVASIYMSTYDMQCEPNGLMPLADMERQLADAHIAVRASACAISGRWTVANCNRSSESNPLNPIPPIPLPDRIVERIGIFEVAADDVSAAMKLGFSSVKELEARELVVPVKVDCQTQRDVP